MYLVECLCSWGKFCLLLMLAYSLKEWKTWEESQKAHGRDTDLFLVTRVTSNPKQRVILSVLFTSFCVHEELIRKAYLHPISVPVPKLCLFCDTKILIGILGKSFSCIHSSHLQLLSDHKGTGYAVKSESILENWCQYQVFLLWLLFKSRIMLVRPLWKTSLLTGASAVSVALQLSSFRSWAPFPFFTWCYI